MSQHDFNIANQSFPATRTDLNNALAALASNSSGDAEPGTTYANQWWYETDTNTLKLRNEANSAWIEIATLDQSSNNVLSITTQGLTLGSTAITASGTEINLLDDLTRGSLIYGNASGVTSGLVKGGAGTVLTSDGTDISWQAPGSSNPYTALSTAATGYITLVGGLIIQWGSVFVGGGATVTATFAIAFPNAVHSVTTSWGNGATINNGAFSTTSAVFSNSGGAGNASNVYYIAIGH